MRTYDEIKEATINKGYTWFEGAFNLNTIWERTSDVITNRFTDWFYVAYTDDSGNPCLLVIPATTKPGLHNSIDRLVQPTVDGKTGTAIKIPGQYISSHQYWINKGVSDFEKAIHSDYFRQVRGENYWRDSNRDTVVDHMNEQDQEIFGTHWHAMSNPGTYGSGEINNWSEGCSGSPAPEWEKVLPLVQQSLDAGWPNAFTETLMETKDFN